MIDGADVVVPAPPTCAADEFTPLDAVAQADLVRRGQASPRDLLMAAIGRIEALDGASGLNAVVTNRFAAALAEADEPLPDGPFRGVPLLLKDLWPSMAGEPMHMGNEALRAAGHRAAMDSNLVRRYREAGFVIAGRTNSPELGLVATTEPLSYGPTRNPWNSSHSPGGSSGGAAAAVAARLVPIANASDGGGSIRIPASSCGLIGLKPSRGRNSMGPFQDEWGVSVQHVVSLSVRDSAIALDASCAPFATDGVIAPPPPSGTFAAALERDPGVLRIGLMAESPSVETDPECAQVARSAAARLQTLGHHVDDSFPDALRDMAVVSARFTTQWTLNAAANVARMGAMIGRELGPEDVEPTTWLMVEMGRRATALELNDAGAAMSSFRRALAPWWAHPNALDGGQGYDLLITPTVAAPPPPLGLLRSSKEDPLAPFRESTPFATFTAWVNAAGQPAINVPTGMTASGLPIGVQLVAAYGREDLLLQAAAQLMAQ
jgi:amidase